MLFNEHQDRLWRNMINLIEDFRKGNIQYSDVVNELESALDAGEFENITLIKRWYNYWTPLEILNATKGNNTTIEDADKYLLEMERFLRSQANY